MEAFVAFTTSFCISFTVGAIVLAPVYLLISKLTKTKPPS